MLTIIFISDIGITYSILLLVFIYMGASDLTCFFLLLSFSFQSLKSRGIRFPGRDTECLAPIFTPPRSVAASESNASLSVQRFSAEQIKIAFDVARNSTELLKTVLSSSPHEDVLEVLLLVIIFFFFWSSYWLLSDVKYCLRCMYISLGCV